MFRSITASFLNLHTNEARSEDCAYGFLVYKPIWVLYGAVAPEPIDWDPMLAHLIYNT